MVVAGVARGVVLRRGIRRLTHAAALATLAWFGYRTIVPAWNLPSSDFPNYYTAAGLARDRAPLHLYYDWTWFQRRIHFAGIDGQLGGYIPQTPLTLLPFVPLSLVPAPQARKIWLAMNCGFLAISLWLLTRITSLNFAQLWLIAFLSGDALRNNFLLGQYYLFLLALLTGAAYCLLTNRRRWAGALSGSAFVLKLYGGPLLLLMLAKRRWSAVATFAAVCAIASCSCALWFGFDETVRYTTQILPRTLAGETLNPFHTSNNTATTLLRRSFMTEGELNPHPWMADSPFLFFLCESAFTLVILALTWFGSIRCTERQALALWLVAAILVSPNTASYTFALQILPVALLFDEMPLRRWLPVLAALVLTGLPLRPAWGWLFPRLWLLLIVFALIGYVQWKAIPVRRALAAGVVVMIFGIGVGFAGARSVREEPAARFTGAAVERDAIYAGSPVVSSGGLLYEAIGADRYVIRIGEKTFELPNDAFHPSVPDSGTPVYFESVNGTDSKIMRLDPGTGRLATVPLPDSRPERPAVSHDGRILAFLSEGRACLFDGRQTRVLPLAGNVTSLSFAPGDFGIVFAAVSQSRYRIGRIDPANGSSATLLSSESELASPSLSFDGRILSFAKLTESGWQVRIRLLAAGREIQITNGRCNSTSPAWYAGRRQIVFASDCGRGLGLPSLYTTGLFDDTGDFVSESLDSKTRLPLASAIH